MTESKSNTVSEKTKEQEGASNFFIPLAIVLSAILVSVSIIYSGSNSKNTDTTAEEGSALGESDETQNDNQTAGDYPTILNTLEGNFRELDVDICEQGGKPEIYLFSTTWCSHCSWIKETFDSWAKANSDKIIVHHWELDTNDDTLTEEVETEVPQDQLEVYQNANPDGTVPTFVFGCRYVRPGNGYEGEDDLTKEIEAFDAILEELI